MKLREGNGFEILKLLHVKWFIYSSQRVSTFASNKICIALIKHIQCFCWNEFYRSNLLRNQSFLEIDAWKGWNNRGHMPRSGGTWEQIFDPKLLISNTCLFLEVNSLFWLIRSFVSVIKSFRVILKISHKGIYKVYFQMVQLNFLSILKVRY